MSDEPIYTRMTGRVVGKSVNGEFVDLTVYFLRKIDNAAGVQEDTDITFEMNGKDCTFEELVKHIGTEEEANFAIEIAMICSAPVQLQ